MTPVGGPAQPPHERPGYVPYREGGQGGQGTPPGFGAPGAVPTLHGEPLPPRGVPGQRKLFAAMAFFAVLLVFSVAGLIVTNRGEIRDGAALVRRGIDPPPAAPGVPKESASARAPGPRVGPVPKPVRYTGTGNKKITVRRPEPGETLVYVKGNAGGGIFFVFALDKGGKQIGVLVNAREAYEGVRLLEQVSLLKAHTLEIQAQGAWTVELRSARSAKAFTGSASGRGDMVLRYEGPAGTAAIRGGSTDGPFTVITHQGGFPRLVATSLGAASTRKPWPAGPVLVEVQAPGAWSIRVT